MSNELTPFNGSTSGASLSRAEQRDHAAVARQTRNALARASAASALAVATEHGRALLTEEALLNVGSLSALEGHLITIAPLGAARYQTIVDAYALGASGAIGRWGR